MNNADVTVYDLQKWLSPLWKGNTVYAETAFILKNALGEIRPKRLRRKITLHPDSRQGVLQPLQVILQEKRFSLNHPDDLVRIRLLGINQGIVLRSTAQITIYNNNISFIHNAIFSLPIFFSNFIIIAYSTVYFKELSSLHAAIGRTSASGISVRPGTSAFCFISDNRRKGPPHWIETRRSF